jgi:heme-degrading monooxygenase HmoA
MFIAMNRFRVVKGSEAEFEAIWTSRRTRLDEMPGFLAFRLLRGPQKDDHTLYASHSSWASRDDFLNWTRSEQFRDSHRNAGQNRALYLGPPDFEGFDCVLAEGAAAT